MIRAALSAYVLHRWDWSESSLILDLFTREQGRVVVAAKGAKRPHSNFRAVLLPLQRIQVGLGRAASGDGASEIQNLRSAEWAGGAPMLGGAALFSGLYLNELLMKLIARHDPHASLFDAYAQTVARLDQSAALRAFELVLLKETGVLPDLGLVTVTQEPLRVDAGYALRSEAGLAATGEGAVPGAAWLAVQAALLHGSLPALEAACAPVLPELKPMLRHLLHYHLGSSTLRTRDVMRSLQDL